MSAKRIAELAQGDLHGLVLFNNQRSVRDRLGDRIEIHRWLYRLCPSVFGLVTMAARLVFLAQALKTIPVGTGYAVWIGIGAVGSARLCSESHCSRSR